MQKMVRQQYGLNVTTDKVYDLMFELDPEGLQARGPVGYRKELNGEETSPPNLLMGYQNSPLSLAIYGCIDSARKKLLWLWIWTSNSNPQLENGI